MESKINVESNFRELDDSHKNPNGDPSIGYPQISIRTNRTAERTNLDSLIEVANGVADQYPDDKEERAKQVIKTLTEKFGGGGFGHAWIIIFHSETEYHTYAYHDIYGYVKDGDTNGATNDYPGRGFAYQRIVPITKDQIDFLENTIIPGLNSFSTFVGSALGSKPTEGRLGVYTPLTNCSWFAGCVWNAIDFKNFVHFNQPFPGYKYAERWGIDALVAVLLVADPGVIAESLAE